MHLQYWSPFPSIVNKALKWLSKERVSVGLQENTSIVGQFLRLDKRSAGITVIKINPEEQHSQACSQNVEKGARLFPIQVEKKRAVLPKGSGERESGLEVADWL